MTKLSLHQMKGKFIEAAKILHNLREALKDIDQYKSLEFDSITRSFSNVCFYLAPTQGSGKNRCYIRYSFSNSMFRVCSFCNKSEVHYKTGTIEDLKLYLLNDN